MTVLAAPGWVTLALNVAVEVVVWAVLAALAWMLFRCAFRRRHCPGCSCRTWQRAEAAAPDTRDGDDYPDYWPAQPVGVLNSDGPDSGEIDRLPRPGRHRTT